MQKFEELSDYNRNDTTHFSKWFIINTENKLNTIKQNQLYAGYSRDFNDAFDSQIRLTDDEFHGFVSRVGKNDPDVQILETISNGIHSADTYYYPEVSFLIAQLQAFNIACFSELDPCACASNHMWGLYGNCGKGVAIQYDFGELKHWIQNSEYRSASIYKIKYETLNKFDLLHQIFDHFIKYELSNSIISQIQFLISKTEEWQYEKEWRFIYMNDDVMVKDKECDEVHANIVKRMEVSGNNIFNFIKPTRIIFGWNNYSDSENNRFYDDLNDWASRNNIECIYLDNKIDYKDMTFHKREQRVP